MIEFFRTQNCPACQVIEDLLKKIRAAHKTVIVNKNDDIPDSVPAGTKLPFLIDEKKIIQGSRNIIEHLSELETFRNQWYKFQSDACYCNESGDIE